MLITHARYFQPEVVTTLFRANNVIAEHESVSKLVQENHESQSGLDIYTFAVQYKDFRTQRHAPDHLQLKIGQKTAVKARREIDFYQKIALPMARRTPDDLMRFPRCYDSYHDDLSEQFHLVLEGTNRDYKVAKNNAPPTKRHREHLIETLATLHGYWWDHPLLDDLQARVTAEVLEHRKESLEAKLSELKQVVGSYIDQAHLQILAQVVGHHPERRKERLLASEGLTINHGALVPENILYDPRETMIINWQDWRISFATDDLAMLIPFYWPQHLRDFKEASLLKRYFDILQKHGVSDYTWADLDYDYKASLADIIADLLLQWTRDEHSRGHWRRMAAAMDSFVAMKGTSIYL